MKRRDLLRHLTAHGRTAAGEVAVFLLALVCVAGCAQHARNKSHEILLQNSEEGRQASFTRFMSDQSCGAVTRTFLQGLDESDGTAFWNIACANGTSWVVTIASDDTTRILDCKQYEQSGWQRCFATFEERAAELARSRRSPGKESLPAADLRE